MRRSFIVAVFVGCAAMVSFSGYSAAQGGDPEANDSESALETGSESSPAEATAVAEEVVVIGRSRARLRLQLERAEEAVYDRYNEINRNDEFDIHCREFAVTGSRMLRRVCEPNFWHETEEWAAQETVRGMQGSAFSEGGGAARTEQYYKRRQMAEEMRRLATEDPKFLEALIRLYELQQRARPRGRDGN